MVIPCIVSIPHQDDVVEIDMDIAGLMAFYHCLDETIMTIDLVHDL